MKEDISLDQRQSEVIDFLRFPLIVLVVYVHMLPFQQQTITTAFTVQNSYVFISELISHHIGRIAVPSFFLFSGYFFFLKITSWSSSIYFNSWKSRYKTLLIPYLAWNIIAFLLIMLKNNIFLALSLNSDESYQQFAQASIYDLLWRFPVNYPLWYLWDLIVMTLLTPLFFFFFKNLRAYGLIILFILYLSIFDSGIPGLSTTAIFYFGVGAYFGLFKQNMLELSLRYGKISLCIAIITLAIATYYTASHQNEFWIRLYAISATASLLYLGNKMMSIKSLTRSILPFTETAFFIYVVHLIYIQGWLKGAFQKSLNIMPSIWLIIGYFLVPLICVTIIIIIYYIFKRIMPRTLSFLLGNRAKKI